MAERTGRRPRRHALAGLALLLVPALAACTGDGGDREVLTGTKVDVPAAGASLQLPTGQVRFRVDPAGPVDEDDISGGEEPSGAYVAVTWDWVPGEGIPPSLVGHLTGGTAPATVAVRASGHTFDLGRMPAGGSGEGSSATHYVPADQGVTPDEVTIEVTLSGVSQSIRGDGSERESGRAAGLYDLPAGDTKAACTLRWSVAAGDVECGAATVRLPYVAELGWADEGSSWLVSNVVVGAVSFPDGAGRTEVTRQDERLTLAGAEPVEVLAYDQGAHGELSTLSVFSVPQEGAATIEVARDVLPTAADGSGVRLTGQVVEAR